MAAAMVGSTAPFDSETQTSMQTILLSSVGSQTYSLMRNLVSPAKPGDKTFDELVKLLKDHFNPKPSEIVQRFKFNSRNRKHGETVMEYVAVLRKLAQDCNYGDKLSEMIRDRLVCGIGDDRIQHRLLSEPDLTFDKALKLAQAIETASKDVKDRDERILTRITRIILVLGKSALSVPDTRFSRVSGSTLVKDLQSLECAPSHTRAPHSVLKMSTKQIPSRHQHQHTACYRCGGEQHRAGDCRFIKETCHKCGKVGHIQNRGWSTNSKQGRAQGANYVRQGEEDKDGMDTDEVMFTLYKIDELDVPAEEPFIETLTVNETETQFEMDSGCWVTVMNHLVFKTLGGKEAPKLCKCQVRLRTYTGHRVQVLGAAVVKVQHKGLVQDLPVVVVAGSGPSLVGRYWIRRLGLQWISVPQIHHFQEETSKEVHRRPDPQIHHTLEDVLGEYGEVFKDELGRFKGPPAKLYVDKEAAPRFFKARPVPYAMRGRVEAELNRLLAQEIIEPEGLGVMFGIKRFHKYIYGQKFTIVTDHKPLLSLFSEMRAVPQMASPRIQSRLPLPEQVEVERPEERVLMLESSDITLVTADQVKAWTDEDPVLSRVREMVRDGWSSKPKGEEFAPYEVRKHELSIQNGCVLWGSRVIVPIPGQRDVMRQLHQCHPGAMCYLSNLPPLPQQGQKHGTEEGGEKRGGRREEGGAGREEGGKRKTDCVTIPQTAGGPGNDGRERQRCRNSFRMGPNFTQRAAPLLDSPRRHRTVVDVVGKKAPHKESRTRRPAC
ncbi:hypothetical protein N1851_010298 [Merluccius polli]|uniref:CCHC-type domain-containing protein n=1 Tax=Merluccius polli TaxID=89951 RepID=A0AA47MZK1_MERPO|nr:hypothetical protein N1851_010298 [Merluccius polli]